MWPFVAGSAAWGRPGLRKAKENVTYHDREDDGSHGGLEDPEQGQAHHLQEGEEVDPAQRDVAQVDEVGLVFQRHQEQLQTIHKLRRKRNRTWK